MDGLLEVLFGLFFEMPMEMTIESKRVKPWGKTALMFIVMNLFTLAMALIAADAYQDSGGSADWQIAVIFAAGFFVVSIVVCVVGHRHRWERGRTCPLPKPVAKVQPNVPNPKVTIRTATMADLDQIARVEAECFPAAEAATKEAFAQRLISYADHFWLMFDEDKLISFVDGFVTDEPDLTDEMYADASLHNPSGAWQMIFGVNTVPACRRHGYAAQLIQRAIRDAKKQGRKGVVLTCKPEKVPYYIKFGFMNEGISQNSTHGGAVWHQMRLTF